MNRITVLLGLCLLASVTSPLSAEARVRKAEIYEPGMLPPVDSQVRVAVGEEAPDFILPAVDGGYVRLRDFRGKKNVVISFVPAAWTPVCSDQWPGYNIARKQFAKYNAVLVGITVDNIPTLHAWVNHMGKMWFPVLSDFWPHGEIAERYGVLRSDGTSERALFVVDIRGMIRYVDVHDINQRPPMDELMEALRKLSGGL